MLFRSGARYTPVVRRADKPNAIAWFIRYHPEVSDAQIGKLIGTTKSTINAVRNRTHWNSQNIRAVDPVSLGLCSQIELDEVISKAAEKRRKMEADRQTSGEGPGLKPTQDAPHEEPAEDADEEDNGRALSADDVFRDFTG